MNVIAWENYGYDKFMTRSLSAVDPEYRTNEDFDLNTEDSSLRTSKLSKSINAVKITAGILQSSDGKTYFDLENDVQIVNDGTNDRVLIGKQINGF